MGERERNAQIGLICSNQDQLNVIRGTGNGHHFQKREKIGKKTNGRKLGFAYILHIIVNFDSLILFNNCN